VGCFFLLFLCLGVVWLSYADLDGVPSQTAGVSSLLGSDWNTYVRDNFDSIKFGHVVVADNTAKSAISAVEGIMVYQSDVDTLFLYTGSGWVEAVDTVSLVDSAVETLKINDLAVTTAKINDLGVTTGKIAASAVTSAKIADDTIVNADVNSAAAIAYSKLNLASSVTSADIVDNTVVIGDLATALQAFLTPTGTVSAFAGASAPTGYLLCDGSAVSQTTYAALFAVVGANAFGTDGGGNFSLPNLKGRAVIGVGVGTELTAVLGVTPANMAATVALSAAETAVRDHTHDMKNHTHTGTTGGQSADHSHTTPFIQDSTILRGTGVVFDRVRQAGSTNTGGTSTDHSHSFTSNGPNDNTTNGTTEVAGAAHTNIQPSLPLNYIIKV